MIFPQIYTFSKYLEFKKVVFLEVCFSALTISIQNEWPNQAEKWKLGYKWETDATIWYWRYSWKRQKIKKKAFSKGLFTITKMDFASSQYLQYDRRRVLLLWMEEKLQQCIFFCRNKMILWAVSQQLECSVIDKPYLNNGWSELQKLGCN